MTTARLILIIGFLACTLLVYVRRDSLAAMVRAFLSARQCPIGLAIFRILLFGTLLIIEPAPELYSGQNYDLARTPWPWPHLLPHLPHSLDAMWALKWTLMGAISCAFVGLFTRTSCVVVFLLGLWAYGLPQFTGKMAHLHHLFWFVALCAAAPSGDALSLDSLLRRLRGRAANVAHVAYALPLRIVWILLGIIYFFPGVWKVWSVGLEWMGSDHMRLLLHEKWDQLGGLGPTTFEPPFRADHYPMLLIIGGVGVILFEVGFIFAIWHPVARATAAFVGLIFHWTNHFFLGILFWPIWIFYATFIPFDRIFSPTPQELAPKSALRLERSVSFTRGVGIILIVGNLAFGIVRTDGWPFACYPTFNHRPAESKVAIEFDWVEANGVVTTFRRGEATAAMDHSRWDVLLQRAGRPGMGTQAELQRLWTILKREKQLGATVQEVHVYRATRLIDPDQRSAPPVLRERLPIDLNP
ncbi:MAG TPA: HTTM domain-containing protein [Planctomycetota bacterium]|nr:HTTM domain-containing protein [Planctomycetota bacterium]